MRKIPTLAAIGFLAAGSFVMSSAAFAAAPQLEKEIAAAAAHAGYAAGASDIDGVHAHLHHAVNCLVGPDGSDFSAKDLNPCAALGNGAIPDSTDEPTTSALQDALTSAKAGIAATDYDKAKDAASDTQATEIKIFPAAFLGPFDESLSSVAPED